MTTPFSHSENLYRFAQGFTLLIDAGVSLVRSIQAIEWDTEDPGWRETIHAVNQQVMEGSTLSRAMGLYPDHFPSTFIGMVRAGEVAGQLEVSLQKYAEYLRREMELYGGRAPEEGNRARELSLWCFKLGILLSSGVPILKAMESSVGYPTSDEMKEAVLFLLQTVTEGQMIGKKMADYPHLFPAIVRQMVETGEESGTLDQTLLRLADYLQMIDLIPSQSSNAAPVLAGVTAPPEVAGASSAAPVVVAIPSPAPPEPSPANGPNGFDLADQFLREALQAGASDIHLQPNREGVVARYRENGELSDAIHIGAEEKNRFLSRFPCWRSPEKGVPGRGISPLRDEATGEVRYVRNRSYPYADGTGYALRLHPHPFPFSRLEDLGMAPEQAEACRRFLSRPMGILAVTGAPGSGRTTTLYTLMKDLQANGPQKLVVTVEDPVEIQWEGISQVSASPSEGWGVIEAIRAATRMDADLLMIGDARDAATLEAATLAAVDGKLVILDVTAPDAVTLLEKLLSWEPHRLAGQLIGVLSQRLVLNPCSECNGGGCEACRQTGAGKRTGAFDLLATDTPKMQQLLHSQPSRNELRQAILNEPQPVKSQ